MSSTKKGSRSEKIEKNGWACLSEVLIASINKGQLPIALIGLFFIIWVYKLPSDCLSSITTNLMDIVVLGNFIGYVLSGLFLSFWFLHTKRQRRIYENEIKRISDEKKKLQEQLLGKKHIESSEV